MSSSNFLRLIRDALVIGGERLDLAGEALEVRPLADDSGELHIGDGTYDMDVKVFLGSTSEYVLFDVGNSQLTLEVPLVVTTVTVTTSTATDLVIATGGTFLPATDDNVDLGSATKQFKDGYFDGVLYTSSIDTAVADTLTIGGTTQTNLALGRSGQAITVKGDIVTTVGNGVIVTDKCTAVEGGDGVLHKTTLTFTLTGAHDLDMADDDHGTGIKIYDFPAGSIQILGATCNAVVTSVNAEGGGATFPMALGSVVGADDNTLTSTEADIIPSVAVAGGSAKDFHATLAAPVLFANAGGSDLDLYLNAAITAAVATGAVTIAVTGTVTITWINFGDY